jgi:hypothetical protein
MPDSGWFCGHWTADELARTLKAKKQRASLIRRNLTELEEQIDLILNEQTHRRLNENLTLRM